MRQPIATLSAAERAAVAIMRALQEWDAARPGLLVLDEPTASLNRGEVDALFREVRRVAERGAGVLFVTHMLDEVLELADRVTVLRDGKVVAEGEPVAALDEQQLVQLIVGRSISDLYPDRTHDIGRPALEAEHVYGIGLRGVSLKVHSGEVLGVAGLVGSGREDARQRAVRRHAPVRRQGAGRTSTRCSPTPGLDPRPVWPSCPPIARRLGLDTEDRLHEHVPLPRLGPLQRHGRLRHGACAARRGDWVERLDVQPPLLDRRMEKFSGGNQQKAVLARWLRTDPRVLLLDEPTQGVDIGAKAAIYRHIRTAAEDGMAVLVASSDAEELVHLCDRVLVFRSGSVAVELRRRQLTEERLVAETLGATSHRKSMRIGREPIRVKVIRGDIEAPVEAAGDRRRAAAGRRDAGAERRGVSPAWCGHRWTGCRRRSR